MIKALKEENKVLKEKQENTIKQVKELSKTFKETWENTIKQKEMNKTFQDRKTELVAIKKTQSQAMKT